MDTRVDIEANGQVQWLLTENLIEALEYVRNSLIQWHSTDGGGEFKLTIKQQAPRTETLGIAVSEGTQVTERISAG